MSYVQDPPNSIQVEPTEGCNLACSFCSMHALREHGSKWHTYKMMDVATVRHAAKLVAKAQGWNPRWEFAMHGEPTLNSNLPQMIKSVRKNLPGAYILLTTNGVPLLRLDTEDGTTEVKDDEKRQQLFEERIDALFAAGANTIAIDNYGYLKNKVANHARQYSGKIGVHEYPSGGAQGNPHPRHSGKKLVIVEDISEATKGTHSLVTNQGGTAGPKDYSRQGQRCAKPFREIAIRWDGNVAICCDDWAGRYAIGNINDYKDIEKLWQHERFQAARRKLYHGERDFGACDGCNVRSYRVGLLPDHKGLEALPRAGSKSRRIIAETLAQEPLSPVVDHKKRPWLADLLGEIQGR